MTETSVFMQWEEYVDSMWPPIAEPQRTDTYWKTIRDAKKAMLDATAREALGQRVALAVR